MAAANPTPTPTPPPVACIGSCDGDAEVTVNEITTLVNITLGDADASACESGIPTGADVNITLIVQAVNNALDGCLP